MQNSDTVIRVERLGKRYKLGQTHHSRLSDLLTASSRNVITALGSFARGRYNYRGKSPKPKVESLASHPDFIGGENRQQGSKAEKADHESKRLYPRNQHEFWAVSNMSFEVKRGDVVGIIGVNGAGKSTLFKILARITEPTEGRVWMKGRVASLLEVGTGFHPELTGRENIYLNGAILGMRQAEIRKKFDQIVSFAEVERFVDTPVKRYSSGMYVRLAFAVAAHLEPEILLVDEVLAVGDAAFQHKCLGKMKEVTKDGRTILFVSHIMPSVESLCDWTMVLDNGKINFQGDTEQAITHYLRKNAVTSETFVDLKNHRGRSSHAKQIFQSIGMRNHRGEETTIIRIGDGLTFELTLDIGEEKLVSPRIQIVIRDGRDTSICRFVSDVMTSESYNVVGRTKIRCCWTQCRLVPGTYRVNLELKHHHESLDKLNDAIIFEVRSSDIYGTGKLDITSGLIVPDGSWEFPST